MTRTVAVTGAGGYVGGRLVEHLEASGTRAVPIVRWPVPWMPDAVHVDTDDDADRLAEAMAGADAVVHLAGANEVEAGVDPERTTAATVAAARLAIAAARVAGIERIVHLSTVHVYGAAIVRLDGAPITEDVVPEPTHPYADARLRCEEEFRASGVPTVVLRLTNGVGPPTDLRVDRWSLVANELCRQAATGGPLVLRSSGLQQRDFVDLADVVRIIDEATHVLPPGTYNVASGRARRVLDLAGTIADLGHEVTGTRPELRAPDHEGPLPAALHVDTARLRSHVAPPSDHLDDALRALIRQCLSGLPGSGGHG